MPRGYPPSPSYPDAIDSDTTLYAVYNTSESTLTSDNLAWSEEIPIVPVGAEDNEIWAGNGFINISGELIYYDLVGFNSNGKVNKFKRCLRNFGGSHTQFNPEGTPVRGFVVAEHHNQLVDALLNVEDFVGYNFTPDETTLDWRIRNLQNTPLIFDDYGCPSITLSIETLSSDPSSGTVIAYSIQISGTVSSFVLQFGDGFSTTSTQPGQHTYAPNANIDPVITASNGDCTVTQTAIERTSANSPTVLTPVSVFPVVIPNVPSFPDLNISVAPTNFNLPIIPINFPCLDLGISGFNIPSVIDINGSIPSVIDINGSIPSVIDINGSIPSIITLVGTLPSIISIESSINIPSVITFEPVINIPSVISFGPAPTFNTIQFAPVSFPTVNFGPVIFPQVGFLTPNFPLIQFGDSPTVSVDWGEAPVISCNCSITCPGASSMTMQSNMDAYDDLGMQEELPNIEYNFAGIPSEIRIVPANIPAYIALTHDLPSLIEIVAPKIPDIKINATDIPREIHVIVPEIRDIRIIADNIPSIITLDASGIPSLIRFENINIPSIIELRGDIPSEIKFTGIPNSIQLKHDLPEFISLKMPENPVISVDIAPISVVLDMHKIITDGEGEGQCFMMVPCGR